MTRRAITILSVLAALGATSIGVGTAAAKHGADDAVGHARHTSAHHKTRAHHHHRARGRDDAPGHDAGDDHGAR